MTFCSIYFPRGWSSTLLRVNKYDVIFCLPHDKVDSIPSPIFDIRQVTATGTYIAKSIWACTYDHGAPIDVVWVCVRLACCLPCPWEPLYFLVCLRFRYLIFVDHAGILGIPKIPHCHSVVFPSLSCFIFTLSPPKSPSRDLSCSLFICFSKSFLTCIIICFIPLFCRSKKATLVVLI
jgi:hypothetical protein